MRRLPRRVALLLPLLLAACGDDEDEAPPPRADFPPLRYGYLPPIRLNVQRMETGGDFVPPSGPNEVSGLSPINIGETLFAMARDRLKPVASDGIAKFQILSASIKRHDDTLRGELAVRVDVRNGDGSNSGYVVARSTAENTAPIRDLPTAIYNLLKKLMDGMNVELEYQLRNKLRSWVIDQTVQPPSQTPPSPPVSPSDEMPVPPTPPPVPPPSESE